MLQQEWRTPKPTPAEVNAALKGFVHFRLTPEDLDEAHRRYRAFTGHDSLRIVDTERARIVGFLGEIAFANLFAGARYAGDKNDMTVDYWLDDLPIEVKSSFFKWPPPWPTSHVFVDRTKEQFSGSYVFVMILENYQEGWFVGWKDAEEYRRISVFERKGSALCGDARGRTGGDRYKLKIGNLNSMMTLSDLQWCIA